MVKLSNYFGKNLWCTFTQMLNEKKIYVFNLNVIKSWVANKYTDQQIQAAKKKDTIKRHYKPYMAKKTMIYLPWNTEQEK